MRTIIIVCNPTKPGELGAFSKIVNEHPDAKKTWLQSSATTFKQAGSLTLGSSEHVLTCVIEIDEPVSSGSSIPNRRKKR